VGTEGRLQQYRQFLDRGLPVFTVDYCVDPSNADAVYEQSADAGLVPLVTRVDLSQLTETPPPSGS